MRNARWSYPNYLYITVIIIVNFHQITRYSCIYLPVIFCEPWLSGLFFLLAALAGSPPLWSTEALFLYLPCFVELLLDLSELLLFWTLTSSSTISSCINNKQFSNISPPSCSSEDTGLSPGRVFIFVSSCSVVSKGMIEICWSVEMKLSWDMELLFFITAGWVFNMSWAIVLSIVTKRWYCLCLYTGTNYYYQLKMWWK